MWNPSHAAQLTQRTRRTQRSQTSSPIMAFPLCPSCALCPSWWPRRVLANSTFLIPNCMVSLHVLQPLGDRKFPFRFVAPPGLLQQLREQVMRRLVVRIVLNGTPQHVLGGLELVGP